MGGGELKQELRLALPVELERDHSRHSISIIGRGSVAEHAILDKLATISGKPANRFHNRSDCTKAGGNVTDQSSALLQHPHLRESALVECCAVQQVNQFIGATSFAGVAPHHAPPVPSAPIRAHPWLSFFATDGRVYIASHRKQKPSRDPKSREGSVVAIFTAVAAVNSTSSGNAPRQATRFEWLGNTLTAPPSTADWMERSNSQFVPAVGRGYTRVTLLVTRQSQVNRGRQ